METPLPGSVVHVDLYSDDPSATAGFYARVFGWRTDADAGGEDAFAAPAPPHGRLLDRAEAPGFDPPATLVHLLVEDLEDATGSIQAAGGKILAEGLRREALGRVAVFQAPGGVTQAILEPDDPETLGGVAPTPPPTGTLVHVEMHSSNEPATRRFHRDVFGWSFQELEDTGYHVATLPSPPDGGLFARQDGPLEPPATLVYVLVDAVADALDAIRDAGGTVLGERYEIEGFGAFGVFEAPGGLVQAVWETL